MSRLPLHPAPAAISSSSRWSPHPNRKRDQTAKSDRGIAYFLYMKICSILAALVLFSAMASAQTPKSGPWEMQVSGTTASLRGIHSVGGGVVWASGTDGTVLRTEDSGYMWQSCAMPPGAEKLDFRGIWAWDADTAIVMSSGPGDQSRLYKTTDGCSHWTLLKTNQDRDGFWDAIQFSDTKNGYLLGDPVNNRFVLLRTEDGGVSWKQVDSADLSTGALHLGAFAASNSSIALVGPVLGAISVPWIGTGGPQGPFVLQGGIDCTMGLAHSNPEECLKHYDFQHIKLPMAGDSASTGVFSIAVQIEMNQGIRHAIAVGGDYMKPNVSAGTAAWTADGGQHWTAATKPPHGYRSAVTWDEDAKAWIAAGTNGSDISYDDGKTWLPLDDGNWNAISLPWIVGPKGRIAKLGALPPAPPPDERSVPLLRLTH
jgi:photosystem II stability/assembly factor-like uncharacterized protein